MSNLFLSVVSLSGYIFMHVFLPKSGGRQGAGYWPTSFDVSVTVTLASSSFISCNSEKGLSLMVNCECLI